MKKILTYTAIIMAAIMIGSLLVVGGYRLGLKGEPNMDKIDVNDIVGVYEYESGDFYIEVADVNQDEILVYEFSK